MNKERPIIFSGPMVRAILEGRKTQTRLVVELPRAPMHLGNWEPFMADGYLDKACTLKAPERITLSHTRTGQCVGCPYGVPGDRLWVRERHCFLDVSKSSMSGFPLGAQNNNERGPAVWNLCIEYSDGTQRDTSLEGDKPKQTRERGGMQWRPAIHMPRWACRLVLEVTAVRVERLQDISQQDVFAEGLHNEQQNNMERSVGRQLSPQECYRRLWDSLNAKRAPWASNPWVWVLEFKRV